MAARKRRPRDLAAILALVSWILLAAALAHPTPAAAMMLAFGAGLVTGGALAYHFSQPRGPHPRGARGPAAGQAPRRPAATRRPAPAAPPRPAPGGLRPVPGPDALRANLAARADRVSTRIPAPPESG